MYAREMRGAAVSPRKMRIHMRCAAGARSMHKAAPVAAGMHTAACGGGYAQSRPCGGAAFRLKKKQGFPAFFLFFV